MKSLWKLLTTAVGIAVLSTVFSTNAHAQLFLWNRLTYITTNQPIEIPGNIVLPAGQYRMKLLDLDSNRNVVQFFSGDGAQLYNTVYAINDYRLDPAPRTEITFYESETGRPPAIRSWFLQGQLNGLDFVYPKARWHELAMAKGSSNVETISYNNAAVAPEAMDDSSDNMSSTPAVDNTAAVVPDTSSDMNGDSDGETAAVAPAATTDDTTPVAVPDESQGTEMSTPSTSAESPAPANLPKTAGVEDLVLLIGVGSSIGVFALNKFRR